MFPEGIARITLDFSVEINLHISPNILQFFSYYSEQHKMRRVLKKFFHLLKSKNIVNVLFSMLFSYISFLL